MARTLADRTAARKAAAVNWVAEAGNWFAQQQVLAGSACDSVSAREQQSCPCMAACRTREGRVAHPEQGESGRYQLADLAGCSCGESSWAQHRHSGAGEGSLWRTRTPRDTDLAVRLEAHIPAGAAWDSGDRKQTAAAGNWEEVSERTGRAGAGRSRCCAWAGDPFSAANVSRLGALGEFATRFTHGSATTDERGRRRAGEWTAGSDQSRNGRREQGALADATGATWARGV